MKSERYKNFILSAIGLFFVIFFAISVLIVPLRSISSGLGNGFNLSFSNQFQYSFSNRFLLILGMLTILGYVMNIVGMDNYRKSFHLISQATGIDYFRIIGNLYLWGAITSIIFIGGLLFLVAEVLLAVAFFSLPDSA